MTSLKLFFFLSIFTTTAAFGPTVPFLARPLSPHFSSTARFADVSDALTGTENPSPEPSIAAMPPVVEAVKDAMPLVVEALKGEKPAIKKPVKMHGVSKWMAATVEACVGEACDTAEPATAVEAAFATEEPAKAEPAKAVPVKPNAKKAEAGDEHHKLFEPLVTATRHTIFHDDEKDFLKFRGKVIKAHTEIIGDFVDTASTRFGHFAMDMIYIFADKNDDGTLETDELINMLHSSGFKWLKAEDIMKRFDADGNGVVDIEEFVEYYPKTLRTNLLKLAKQNGKDLGFID